MDDEDAKNIYDRLQSLESNGQKQLDLIQEQTSIVRSNYETLRKPIEDLKGELDEVKQFIQEHSEKQDEKIEQIEKNEKSLWSRLAINEFSHTVIIQLQELERQLTVLANILSSVNTGKLHPMILSYNQIDQHIRNLSTDITIDHDIGPLLLQQLAEVQSAHYRDTLLVKIKIPLLNKENFNLEKVHYIPVPLGKQVAGILDLHEEYISYNEGKNEYVMLQHSELDNHCKEASYNITSHIIACKFSSPILTSASKNCLILLHKGWSEAQTLCPRTTIHLSQKILIKLERANTWIYVLQEETEIHIECPQFHTTLRLRGEGILSIQSNCQAQMDNYILKTETTINSEYSIEQPDIPLTWEMPSNLSATGFMTTNLTQPKLQISNSKTHNLLLNRQKEKIVTLERHVQQEMQRRREEQQHMHSTVTISVGATVTLLLCTSVAWLLWKVLSRRTPIRQVRFAPNKRPTQRNALSIEHVPPHEGVSAVILKQNQNSVDNVAKSEFSGTMTTPEESHLSKLPIKL